MNVNKSALDKAYRLAHDSGKVEPGRLVKALKLVEKVRHTFSGTYTDGSLMDEYWVPGSEQNGYVITVRNNKVSGCVCKDHKQHPTIICKHGLSIMLILKAQTIDPVADPVPAPLPADYRNRMISALWPND